MGKGKSKTNERGAMRIGERTNPFNSEVERILSRVAIRPKKPRRSKEIMNGQDLYEKLVDQHPVLPYPIQTQLAIIAQDKNQPQQERIKARQALAFYNQRWVLGQAHSPAFKGRGVEVEDLINAGNIGLMEAIDQFKPSMGNTFITYAKRKIFMRMQRLTEEDSAAIYGARIPTDRYNEIGTVKRALGELTDHFQREPTIEELTLHANADRPKDKQLSQERVESALATFKNRPTSMQATLRSEDGDDLEFGHTLADKSPGIEAEVANRELSQIIDEAFKKLDPDQQKVVGSYLGYGSYPQLKSLRQVAEYYKMEKPVVDRIYMEGQKLMKKHFKEAGLSIGSLEA